jgi:hypothetical protein
VLNFKKSVILFFFRLARSSGFLNSRTPGTLNILSKERAHITVHNLQNNIEHATTMRTHTRANAKTAEQNEEYPEANDVIAFS